MLLPFSKTWIFLGFFLQLFVQSNDIWFRIKNIRLFLAIILPKHTQITKKRGRIQMNEFVLLAGSKDTRTALVNQLQEIMDGYVRFSSYSIEEELPDSLHDQLVVLSHPLVLDEPKIKACLGTGCKVIIAKRIINYENIDKLLYLPAGTNALYVNDSLETCLESIESLKKLGIDHIHYNPFYPGI